MEEDRQGNPTITLTMVEEDTIIIMVREETTDITVSEDITTAPREVGDDTPGTVTCTTTKQERPTGTRRAIITAITAITIRDED